MAEDGHSIRNSVIASVIVVFISWLGNQLFGWWPWLQSVVAAIAVGIWKFLTASIAVPVWVWIIIAVGLVPTAVLLIRLLRGPKWSDYREDMFSREKWRWQYNGDLIDDICCFCDREDTALVCSRISGRFDDPDRIEVNSEGCGKEHGGGEGNE